jgi:hypothetical protein
LRRAFPSKGQKLLPYDKCLDSKNLPASFDLHLSLCNSGIDFVSERHNGGSMNAYISNDGIPSQKVPFLLKKSSYRLFLYSLSLCFTAVSFFHSSTVHAANKKAQVPKDISSTLPVSKNISAEIQSLQLQKAEILAKSFNGNLNHCDPKNIQTAGSLKELTTLEEVFLDKFTGLSSYQVFQIDGTVFQQKCFLKQEVWMKYL